MVDILGHGQHTGAQPPLVPGVLGVALDLEQFTVFYMRQNPAAAVAARTGGPRGSPHYLGTSRTHGCPSIKSWIVFPVREVLKNKYQAVSQSARRFGKRCIATFTKAVQGLITA
jgi:hypothetical protein